MASNDKYEWALPVGTKLSGGQYPYEVVDVLGHGGFGITYKVKARVPLNNIKVDVFFAIKEYFPMGCWRGDDGTTIAFSRALEGDMLAGLKDFVNEGERLRKICNVNPHIVNVNEVFQANGTAYFVMEYLSGGDLRRLLKSNGGPLGEAAMLSILGPIGSAIAAVHDNHILHLDIKPENIVMRQGDDGTPQVPVLIDFGIAVHFDSRGKPTTTHPTKGVTPGYSPAEQYAGVKRFDPRFDIYSLSATCYYMLTGKDPLEAFEVDESAILAELTALVSKRTCDAIMRGMARMASERPASVAEFLKSFNESNALAIGTVVPGTACRYMIKMVIDETPGYVHYQASLAGDDERERDPNRTRDMRNRGNLSRLYDLYEQLNNGKRIAAGDEPRSWSLPLLDKARYTPMQWGVQMSKGGGVSSEYFIVEGTQYLALCEGYKAPPRQRKPLKRWLKIALLATAIAALTALAVWGVTRLLSNNGGSTVTPPATGGNLTFTVNGVSFTMVAVPGGTFTMGATSEQGSDADSDEKPTHSVTLSSFYIGQTEVTQELWQAVMGENPSWFNGTGSSRHGTSHSENYGINVKRPVESVSWDDCQEFLRKLNQKTGKQFRLPTEAEWEYAARGGRNQGYKYSGSNNIDDVAVYQDNSYNKGKSSSDYGPHSVASKRANELGLYDMSGNVWEWCSDWYGSYSSSAQTSPTGPSSGYLRVGRGGGWSIGARLCRVSFRVFNLPGHRYINLGLRLAL